MIRKMTMTLLRQLRLNFVQFLSLSSIHVPLQQKRMNGYIAGGYVKSLILNRIVGEINFLDLFTFQLHFLETIDHQTRRYAVYVRAYCLTVITPSTWCMGFLHNKSNFTCEYLSIAIASYVLHLLLLTTTC